jgi:hypothetical protein
VSRSSTGKLLSVSEVVFGTVGEVLTWGGFAVRIGLDLAAGRRATGISPGEPPVENPAEKNHAPRLIILKQPRLFHETRRNACIC